MLSMKNKSFNLLLIAVVTVVAVWSLWPTWRDYSLSQHSNSFHSTPDSLRFALSNRDEIENARKKSLKLGLDLKGGMHLVMEVDLVDQYLKKKDWKINENSNMDYSLQGLNNYISSEVSKVDWLNEI